MNEQAERASAGRASIRGVLRGNGCRVFRLQRDKVGLSKGDLLMVVADAIPEGGEFVIDLEGRVCRHGGGPVMGVIVGVVRVPPKNPSAPGNSRGAGRGSSRPL
jgi:hypothetical protein